MKYKFILISEDIQKLTKDMEILKEDRIHIQNITKKIDSLNEDMNDLKNMLNMLVHKTENDKVDKS